MWPSDAIWQHRSAIWQHSWVNMAHCLNQCWLFISKDLWYLEAISQQMCKFNFCLMCLKKLNFNIIATSHSGDSELSLIFLDLWFGTKPMLVVILICWILLNEPGICAVFTFWIIPPHWNNARPYFNIKTVFPCISIPIIKIKTVLRWCYLHNGTPCTGKMVPSYLWGPAGLNSPSRKNRTYRTELSRSTLWLQMAWWY